jgi:flagellar biosynthesis protein FlhB
MVELVAHPKAEIYTNPQHAAIALKYFQDVAAFERESAAGR